MRNEDRIKKFLFDLGHFRNPEMPTGISSADDLPKLSLAGKEVRTAIRSYQDFMRHDFDRLALKHHNRLGDANGEFGPATAELFNLARCECPDFPDDVAMATGRGSWHAGLWEEYPDHHAFGVYWDKSNMPSFLRGVIDQCIELCYASYRDIGNAFFTSPDRNRCNTVASWRRGRGWIGLAVVGQNHHFDGGDPIWANFDTQYRPRALVHQWAKLLTHEFGHNMGLHHSRGGIMNPSITSGEFTKTAWRGDPSEPILTRWFGGEPVPPLDDDPDTDPDDPDPKPPEGSRVVFKGFLEPEINGKSQGKYGLYPVPRI